MNSPIYGLLGLALRAGKLTVGQDQSLRLLQRGRAHLILLAADASGNTKKVFQDKGKFYGVPVREIGPMERLGKALGKGPRAVVAVADEAFARNMLKKMKAREVSDPM